MQESYSKITANFINDRLLLKIDVNGSVYLHEKKLRLEKNVDLKNILMYWLMNAIKPVMYNMPLSSSQIECSKEVGDKFKDLFVHCQQVLTQTNGLISNYIDRKGAAKNNDRVLLFNCDDSHFYTNFYPYLQEANKEKVEYLNMESGFNSLLRRWEEPKLPYELEDFIEYLLEQKIKRILAPNFYWLEYYFNRKLLYLLPLFKYLGFEFVVVDNDNGDLTPNGYLQKFFYNCDDFKRLSFSNSLRFWFNKYKLDNVQFFPSAAQNMTPDAPYTINDDYKMLVLSNSRLNQVINKIIPVLFIMEHFDKNDLYVQYHLWFYSLRYMILKVMDLDEFERMHYNSNLFTFFHTGLQFLKYVIIDSINDKYDIDIYGDAGWGEVFPEKYQNKMLNYNEIGDVIKTNQYILLPFNTTHSWVTCPGPLLSAVCYNIPFLSMAALVHSREFEGFKMVEYHNGAEMNDRIANIKEIFNNKQLLDSIKMYKTMVVNNLKSVSDQVVNNMGQNELVIDEYIRQRNHNHDLVNERLRQYINKNEFFLRDTFQILFQNKPIQRTVDLTKSRFYNTKFVQRIFQLKGQKK